MSESKKGVKVDIQGRQFVIACNEEEHAILDAAASLVESKLEQVQASGKVVGMDKCAILVALNIASELMLLENKGKNLGEVEARVAALKQKIDAAIQEQNQMSI